MHATCCSVQAGFAGGFRQCADVHPAIRRKGISPATDSKAEAATLLRLIPRVPASRQIRGRRVNCWSKPCCNRRSFCFRLEQGGNDVEGDEIANRLSYFLWDTHAGCRTVRSAAAGELSTAGRSEQGRFVG